MLRLRLKAQGIDDSWQTLREAMSTQQRVTATMQRRDGRAVLVRKATRPDAHHHKINTVLGLSDFTVCNELGVFIGEVAFPHRLYQFALATEVRHQPR